MKPDACPQDDELQQLLSGSLSGTEQEECTRHMDSCMFCQAKLEKIATGDTDLSQLVSQVDHETPLATSAYWPALKALNDGVAQTIAPSRAPRSRQASLDFLQPASDSVYLGRLGQFEVMRVLGRGGMGVVLEAFDPRLHRNVALKVLDPDFAEDETARQRFCREARAAASITHENVVAVHQVERAGGQDGLPFLVMQIISGESLEQRLQRQKTLPLREIVRIGMQAARGLEAAHAAGLIHRDIKPGNILLEASQDRVKLTDFGLARVVEDARLTQTGMVSGTPLYMAPEQALGGETDARSDLFSLGAVLYEMCAGQPPFAGNSALAILKQIAETRPRPIRELNPAIPDWFTHTVDRLLAKKPADRIQSASHLAELFEFQWALLKTSSEDVPQICQIEEARERRRNRMIAAGIATLFLTLGLLAGRYFLATTAIAPSAATGAPAAAEVEGAAASPEPAAVLSANAGTVWAVAIDPAGTGVTMATEDGLLRLWDLPSKSITSTLSAHRGIIWAARYSPDGELFATAGDDGLIKLWKPGQSEPLATMEHRNAVRGLAFSPDGQNLLAGDRSGVLRVWSVADRQSVAEAQLSGSVYALAVSPNGETLATAGSDKIVRLWNAKTLAAKIPLEGHSGPVYGLAFRPDGAQLASVGWDKTIRLWDTATGQLAKSWEGSQGDIWSVAFSPDGSRLATASLDGAVKLWNAQTGELAETYLGHKNGAMTVIFSRDGKLLASGGRDGAVRVWRIE